MICVLLSVSTVILYFPVSGHPFINFDDNVYVTANSHVNSGLNWNNFKWAWTTTTEGNWHPLTWLSHQFDCQLFGLNAGAHHFVNLLLHCSNTLLVFLLLNRSTRAKWQSAMVAALFALHPLNVESVAWVAELKNLLCTFFFLLALGAYGWYAQNPQVKRYLSVFALFAMGLASKPMVITLPFVLLLIDFWPLGRVEGWTKPSPEFPLPQQRFSRLLLEKLPLFVLSAASAIITVMAQRTAGAVASLGSWTITLRLENAIHSYAMYFWRAFLPMDLALYYPALYLQLWEAGLAAVSLLAVSWVVYRFRAHHPYVVMGWLWFLGTLIPVIGLIQIGSQSMADRYAYIPLLGLFIAVVWAVADIAKSTTLDQRWLIAAAAVVLSAFSLITARQLHFWKSSEDLWAHTLHVTTNNFVAEEKLGNALRDVGRDDEALPHFFNAVEIQPDVTSARLILGESLLRHGRYSEAMEHLDAVVRLSKDPSDLCDAYDGLGIASAHIGDRARARQYFVRALQLNSGDQKSLYNLSLLETQEGIEKLSAEVSSHPTPVAYSNLGELFERVHKTAEAKGAYEHALRLNPNLAEAKLALQTLESTSQ
ncbi:MAG TPA: tetratricopeptide repeat protein [Candidatus Sulfotelmatobacter sp.]|nr:tetratricopeptide repeat protein [Candidatus Sulfotelmatobacter sp.]